MSDRPTVVAGFVPSDLGRAVVGVALEEARRRDAQVLVVNVSRGDAYVDNNLADSLLLDAPCPVLAVKA